MKPGIFEVFLLFLIPAILVLRLLSTVHAVIVVTIFLAVVILYTKFVVFGYLKRLNIPHDEPVLFLGNLTFQKGFNELGTENVRRHGKVFGAYIGPIPWIFIADVDLLKDILVKNFHNFTNHMMFPILKESDLTINAKMLFNEVDDKWRNTRSTMSPAFTAGKMKLMLPLMNYCVENLVQTLDKERSKNVDSAISIHSFLGGLTMDVICTCALGTETNSIADPNNPLVVNARKVFDDFENPAMIPILLSFPYVTAKLAPQLGKRLVEGPAMHYLERVVLQILEERRRNPLKRMDMVHLLLNAHEDNDTDEAISMSPSASYAADGSWAPKKHFLSDDEIVAQLLLFLIAGYHTTAATLSFCLYSLATNLEVQRKCFDELDQTEKLTYETIQNKLPYLESVVNETLRMFPIATMLNRETNKDYVTTTGVRIPAGTTVVVPVYAIHHMEEYYENPHTFDPDRFTADEREKRNPLTYLPFGYGPRNCIGMRFALMEIKLTLATLLKKFEFLPCAQTEVPLSVVDKGFLLKPTKPIMLSIKTRSSASN